MEGSGGKERTGAGEFPEAGASGALGVAGVWVADGSGMTGVEEERSGVESTGFGGGRCGCAEFVGGMGFRAAKRGKVVV
jgi:hypothetical protein